MSETASKRVLSKTEASVDLMENKIANKITSLNKSKPKPQSVEKTKYFQERYMSAGKTK